MTSQDIYPNAPVVLVALEIRHPVADPLTSEEIRAIKQELGELLPIERTTHQVALSQSIALTPGALVPPMEMEQFPRFTSRDGAISLSVRKEALVIECGNYPGWQAFRQVVTHALAARMKVSPVSGVERIGLRYIDEVRVPTGLSHPSDWARWVNSALLSPSVPEEIDMPVSQWQGVALYGTQPGVALVLRYGPREGFAVDPDAEIRRTKTTTTGPFFLLDIDSFWTPGDSIPECEETEVLSICEKLHLPIRTLFESMITARLRDEVLRGHGE